MVNENFDKFNKVQKEHQAPHLGSGRNQKPGLNDAGYNNQEDTDKSVGAVGRKV